MSNNNRTPPRRPRSGPPSPPGAPQRPRRRNVSTQTQPSPARRPRRIYNFNNNNDVMMGSPILRRSPRISGILRGTDTNNNVMMGSPILRRSPRSPGMLRRPGNITNAINKYVPTVNNTRNNKINNVATWYNSSVYTANINNIPKNLRVFIRTNINKSNKVKTVYNQRGLKNLMKVEAQRGRNFISPVTRIRYKLENIKKYNGK